MKLSSKIKSVKIFSRVRNNPSRVTFNSNIIAHSETEKVTIECHGKCSVLLGSVACSFVWDIVETGG